MRSKGLIRVHRNYADLIDRLESNGPQIAGVGAFLYLRRNRDLRPYVKVIPEDKVNSKRFYVVKGAGSLERVCEGSKYRLFKPRSIGIL